MPKVLVLFYSQTGRTAAIADAVADGAASVKFTEVELRRLDDLASPAIIEADASWRASRAALSKKYRTLESIDSLPQYDALILGSPARYGIMSAELKHLLDQAAPLVAQGALRDRVASAFGSAAVPNAGHEMNVLSMLVPLMHFGMILVPPVYAGSSGSLDTAAVGDELAMARSQGARVAKVAEWVRHAKSHEAHGHKH